MAVLFFGKISRSENIFSLCIGTKPKSSEIFSHKQHWTETTVTCPKGSGSNFSSFRKAYTPKRKLDQNQYMHHLDFSRNASVETTPISSACWPSYKWRTWEGISSLSQTKGTRQRQCQDRIPDHKSHFSCYYSHCYSLIVTPTCLHRAHVFTHTIQDGLGSC